MRVFLKLFFNYRTKLFSLSLSLLVLRILVLALVDCSHLSLVRTNVELVSKYFVDACCLLTTRSRICKWTTNLLSLSLSIVFASSSSIFVYCFILSIFVRYLSILFFTSLCLLSLYFELETSVKEHFSFLFISISQNFHNVLVWIDWHQITQDSISVFIPAVLVETLAVAE